VEDVTGERRLWRWAPLVVWAALIFIASSMPGASLPDSDLFRFDKLIHGGVYVVLGALAHLALGQPAWALALGVAYGASDELHQVFTPGRSADIWDLLADAVGVGLGIVAALCALWVRQRRQVEKSLD
jgi:VanZ family protein